MVIFQNGRVDESVDVLAVFETEEAVGRLVCDPATVMFVPRT